MLSKRLLLAAALLALVFHPNTAPAPFVYTPGVGWSYESVSEGGSWKRERAKEQLEVARNSYEEEKYGTAIKAAKRTVKEWPLSDYAPEAQYWLGRALEAKKQDEKAFKAYQQLIEKFPRHDRYDEVLARQFGIANRFLAGQWFKLWGYVPFFSSMEKTAGLYRDIIKNGPYSEVAPEAQMNIGAAWEKKNEYSEAVRAYSLAADRYRDRKDVAPDAIYKAAMAYNKQAETAEYDQGVADEAINTFSDFIILFPNDPRVDEARQHIEDLRAEQAKGSYMIARFYEKRKRWDGALIYYNEVLLKDSESELAATARERITRIREMKREIEARAN